MARKIGYAVIEYDDVPREHGTFPLTSEGYSAAVSALMQLRSPYTVKVLERRQGATRIVAQLPLRTDRRGRMSKVAREGTKTPKPECKGQRHFGFA